MHQYVEFFLNHWDLFLALAVILFLLVGRGALSRLRGVGELEPMEAVQKINHEDAVILDVREESEFKKGHVLNSLHVPLGSLSARLGELEKYKQKPIIIGCQSGQRSARACGLLRKHGFESVYNLRGGVMSWQSAGLPLVAGKGKNR